MPLIKSKSKKAFQANVRAEMHAGKPKAQSLAIAYSIKRKSKSNKTTMKKSKQKKPKLGSGKRFAALKSKLASKGAQHPGALAAYIGAKRHGQKKMTQLAVKGKKRASKM